MAPASPVLASWKRRVGDFCVVCGCEARGCEDWQRRFFMVADGADDATRMWTLQLRRRGAPVLVYAPHARTSLAALATRAGALAVRAGELGLDDLDEPPEHAEEDGPPPPPPPPPRWAPAASRPAARATTSR